MDREARDSFELMDEIASKLALETTPLLWPAGMGQGFRGAYDVERGLFIPFGGGEPVALESNSITKFVPEDQLHQLREEATLVRDACPTFDLQSYREGHLTPVYFVSALKEFGVKELLSAVARFAPPPRSQATATREVSPSEDKVTGFVFKVQANMDPNHRDRVAFMRLCSGRFRRGMRLTQVATGKAIGIHNPILFFAQERELVDEAWPGDIIGIPNHGVLRVGDTLTEGESITFTGIPNFAPEILRRIRPLDPMKAKHLGKALESLAEEGVTQVFKPNLGSANWIVGVVGQLQLDVLESRIAAEYGLEAKLEASPYETARWVASDEPAELQKFVDYHSGQMATDRDGAPVFLARSAWELGYIGERSPKIRFSKTRERH
jgi:peptide chain release factor 3